MWRSFGTVEWRGEAGWNGGKGRMERESRRREVLLETVPSSRTMTFSSVFLGSATISAFLTFRGSLLWGCFDAPPTPYQSSPNIDFLRGWVQPAIFYRHFAPVTASFTILIQQYYRFSYLFLSIRIWQTCVIFPINHVSCKSYLFV